MKLKGEFAGTGKVFRFTFLQLLKSKANTRLLILALVASLASVPVLTLVKGGKEKSEPVSLLVIDNKTDLDLDGAEAYLREEGGYDTIRVEKGRSASEPGSVLVLVEKQPEGGIGVALGSVSGADTGEAQGVCCTFYAYVVRQQMKASGLSDKQISLLEKGTGVDFNDWEYYQKHKDDTEEIGYDESQYNTQFGYSVLLMMVCVYSVSFIVRAVVEEKASKLVDLLLVSVKPMALLLGKVLAVLVYVLLYMAVLLCGMFISYTVTGMFLDVSAAAATVEGLLNLKPSLDGLLVIIVSSALGYLAFGILAGLSGAGCSNTEETSGAMSSCMLLIMAGYMVSIVAGGFSGGYSGKVLSVLPVLSMFMAPLRYMKGDMSLAMVGLSWLLELIFLILVLQLASKVYSYLIIYNGKRLTMSDILKMARRKEAKA